MKVIFCYHLRAISCSCFSSQKVGKQDLCSCFGFWKRCQEANAVFAPFLSPLVFLHQIHDSRRQFLLVFFCLRWKVSLLSFFFGHWPHFLALSRWFSGCPRCKETGASELIRCFAFRPFRPWTLHAFASFVEQIAFHSVRLELCGWNILAQQLVKHLCRCPNIVQSLSSVIYGWIFGQKEETKHQCQRVSLQCNIVLLMLRVL